MSHEAPLTDAAEHVASGIADAVLKPVLPALDPGLRDKLWNDIRDRVAAALGERDEKLAGQLAATERATENAGKWLRAYQDEFAERTRVAALVRAQAEEIARKRVLIDGLRSDLDAYRLESVEQAEEIARLREAIAAEREACAQLAGMPGVEAASENAAAIAVMIRRRGESVAPPAAAPEERNG